MFSTWERIGWKEFDLSRKDFSRVFGLRRNVFGRVCDLKMILAVPVLPERDFVTCGRDTVRSEKDFWSSVPPEKDIGRVVYLRMIFFIRVLDLRINFCWSCVRPEEDFGGVFDLMMMKNFDLVFDLRMMVVCWRPQKHLFSSCITIEKDLVLFPTLYRFFDDPERYCGWFLVHCFSNKFQRMTREAMDICLRGLKERNKSRFDSYSVRNNVLSTPILPFGIVACTVFATTFLEIAVYINSDHCDARTTKPAMRKECDHVRSPFLFDKQIHVTNCL